MWCCAHTSDEPPLCSSSPTYTLHTFLIALNSHLHILVMTYEHVSLLLVPHLWLMPSPWLCSYDVFHCYSHGVECLCYGATLGHGL